MAQDTRPESSNEPFNVETKLNPQSLQPHPQQLHDHKNYLNLLKTHPRIEQADCVRLPGGELKNLPFHQDCGLSKQVG